MYLHKLKINPACREARRDLSDPYEMHSTICRAFTTPDIKCPAGAFLWRLEFSKDPCAPPEVLVQSSLPADWSRMGIKDWLLESPGEPVDLNSRLSIQDISLGKLFRFRLRANPCVSRNGKRQGLLHSNDQIDWIVRKGIIHGFKLSELPSFTSDETEIYDVMISHEKMLRGKQRCDNEIRVYSVQFDGILTVTDVEKFRSAVCSGIGHGKTMGLGLLSLVPLT